MAVKEFVVKCDLLLLKLCNDWLTMSVVTSAMDFPLSQNIWLRKQLIPITQAVVLVYSKLFLTPTVKPLAYHPALTRWSVVGLEREDMTLW